MKQMHLMLVAIVFTLTLLTLPQERIHAAKKLIRGPRVVNVSFSKVALSRPTNSAVVSFFNLKKVKRIEYALSYTANGISQGVMGSFVPNGQNTDNRDLYFGTCSKGVCTPHYGIQNATLVVTTVLTSGGTNVKRYKFKKV
jgi:hypothetical protein